MIPPRPAADDPDEMMRLSRFRREHPPPAVTVFTPTGGHTRWRAFIAAGTVPGDDRAMVVTDPKLGAFIGRLERLFGFRKRRDSG